MEEHTLAASPERPADPALDFLSPAFCPQQALEFSPSRIRLPCPEVQPCDNLDHYSSVVRGLSRKLAAPALSGTAQLEEERRVAVPVTGRKWAKSVISVMETPQLGPLSLVQRYHGEGVRVRVVMRHCAGVRGECVGMVLAFDKHLNLVLGDVCEEYSPFRTVANGGLEPRSHRKRRRHKPAATASTQTADRKGRKGGVERVNIKLCRQLDKVFIRGDNIVLISSAPQPTPQLAMVDAPQPMTPQLLDAPLPTCTSH